ncbi:hypothetical protein BKA80DRAFT_37856 [Phyllosticta citrichinensis]
MEASVTSDLVRTAGGLLLLSSGVVATMTKTSWRMSVVCVRLAKETTAISLCRLNAILDLVPERGSGCWSGGDSGVFALLRGSFKKNNQRRHVDGIDVWACGC